MDDKTCQECIYHRDDGVCMLEILEGTNPEDCRKNDRRDFEAKDE